MKSKIKIGISACLLGEKVRHDGGHKHDRFLTQTLGGYFKYVPVCPEFELGLGVPRESLRLEGDPENPRLVTTRGVRDITAKKGRRPQRNRGPSERFLLDIWAIPSIKDVVVDGLRYGSSASVPSSWCPRS